MLMYVICKYVELCKVDVENMSLDDIEDDDLQTIVERNDKELAEEKKFEEMYSGELGFEKLPLLSFEQSSFEQSSEESW